MRTVAGRVIIRDDAILFRIKDKFLKVYREDRAQCWRTNTNASDINRRRNINVWAFKMVNH